MLLTKSTKQFIKQISKEPCKDIRCKRTNLTVMYLISADGKNKVPGSFMWFFDLSNMLRTIIRIGKINQLSKSTYAGTYAIYNRGLHSTKTTSGIHVFLSFSYNLTKEY